MSDSIKQFIKFLIRTGMISDADASSLRDSSDDGTVTEDSVLDSAGYLTEFQKSELRNGKAGNLILGDHLLILDHLGEGAMGEVFLARHTLMKRDVAVKFKLPRPDEKSNSAARQRFRREVQTASKLSHPNVVSALDAGFRGDLCFLVMEYVRGQNLDRLVRTQGPMSFAQTLDIVVQVSRGLEYAHSKGVVHRDIKPSNLLLRNDGVVKILDMGLARFDAPPDRRDDSEATEKEDLTRRGQLLGTIDFMAPEQALNPHEADGRADIYGLGCTLYFLLAGRPPFRTEKAQSRMDRILLHREMSIPRLQDLREDVPEWFNPTFEKMLAKDPTHRFQSVSELLKELDAAVDRESDEDATVDVTLPPRAKPTTTSSWWAIPLVLVMLAVIAGAWYGAGEMGLIETTAEVKVPEVIDRPDRTYDLLEHIRLARDVLSPPQIERWALTQDGLVMPPGDSTAKMKYVINTTDDFRLELDVSRRSGTGPFAVGVVARERQFIFLVDRDRSVLLLTSNGRAAAHIDNSIEINTTEKTRIDVIVEGNTAELLGNGKSLLRWPHIDSLDRVPKQGWSIGDPDAFFLGSNNHTSFEITKMTLKPLASAAVEEKRDSE